MKDTVKFFILFNFNGYSYTYNTRKVVYSLGSSAGAEIAIVIFKNLFSNLSEKEKNIFFMTFKDKRNFIECSNVSVFYKIKQFSFIKSEQGSKNLLFDISNRFNYLLKNSK